VPRLDFLSRAVAIAVDLGAEAVSCWAGVPPAGLPPQQAWDRLVTGCARVVAVAQASRMPLGFEPEPGMLVETIADWARLRTALDAPPVFGLTLDIGHCRCVEPAPVAECVALDGPHLVNVQIDDMRRGVHEHLEFGAGEVDFPPVLRALADADYRGLVSVELPRHSHAAPRVAAESLAFLRSAQDTAQRSAAADTSPAASGQTPTATTGGQS